MPFSTAAEVLGMLVVFELLQEASLRLPQSVGNTVSIIGGLVVGQSAVEAKVISMEETRALTDMCGKARHWKFRLQTLLQQGSESVSPDSVLTARKAIRAI